MHPRRRFALVSGALLALLQAGRASAAPISYLQTSTEDIHARASALVSIQRDIGDTLQRLADEEDAARASTPAFGPRSDFENDAAYLGRVRPLLRRRAEELASAMGPLIAERDALVRTLFPDEGLPFAPSPTRYDPNTQLWSIDLLHPFLPSHPVYKLRIDAARAQAAHQSGRSQRLLGFTPVGGVAALGASLSSADGAPSISAPSLISGGAAPMWPGVSVSFSPDGLSVAARVPRGAHTGFEGTTTPVKSECPDADRVFALFRAYDMTPRTPLLCGDPTNAWMWSPDGRYFAHSNASTSSSKPIVRVYDTWRTGSDGQFAVAGTLDGPRKPLALHPLGEYLLADELWDAVKNTAECHSSGKRCDAHVKRLHHLPTRKYWEIGAQDPALNSFGPDGTPVVWDSSADIASAWDPESGTKVALGSAWAWASADTAYVVSAADKTVCRVSLPDGVRGHCVNAGTFAAPDVLSVVARGRFLVGVWSSNEHGAGSAFVADLAKFDEATEFKPSLTPPAEKSPSASSDGVYLSFLPNSDSNYISVDKRGVTYRLDALRTSGDLPRAAGTLASTLPWLDPFATPLPDLSPLSQPTTATCALRLWAAPGGRHVLVAELVGSDREHLTVRYDVRSSRTSSLAQVYGKVGSREHLVIAEDGTALSFMRSDSGVKQHVDGKAVPFADVPSKGLYEGFYYIDHKGWSFGDKGILQIAWPESCGPVP